MSGIQTVPLRIPDQWDAAWFRTFVAEVLAKADIRNAIGQGVTITSDGNSVATISADAETAGAITGHNADPFAHDALIAAHKAESDPHPQYPTLSEIFPVGAIYLTAEDVSPDIALGFGTWEKRGYGQLVGGG